MILTRSVRWPEPPASRLTRWPDASRRGAYGERLEALEGKVAILTDAVGRLQEKLVGQRATPGLDSS